MDNPAGHSTAHNAPPSKEPHRFPTTTTENNSPESMRARRVREYMASKNGGGDPVTALGVREETPTSSTTARRAKVDQDTNASMAEYHHGP